MQYNAVAFKKHDMRTGVIRVFAVWSVVKLGLMRTTGRPLARRGDFLLRLKIPCAKGDKSMFARGRGRLLARLNKMCITVV